MLRSVRSSQPWYSACAHSVALSLLMALVPLDAGFASDDDPTSGGEASAPAAIPGPILDTAEWMLNRPEARQRAAGLVVLAFDADRDRSAVIIENVRATTDVAAMLWLAHACRAAGIQRQCLDAGLDDAIVRYDSANLFARAELYPRDRIADLIIESRRESMHVFALVEAWYEALSKGPAAATSEKAYQDLAHAFAISAAWTTPALAPLVETCRGATPGAELDSACQQLAGRLVEGGESMLGVMIGRAIQRRGEPAGDDERTAATIASDRAACQMGALEPELMAIGDEGIREFIGLLKRHGEFEAWERLAAKHEIDCSDPPSLLLEDQGRDERDQAFNAIVASVAKDMVASTDDRKRAAGLAWQLTNLLHPIEAPDEKLDELEAQIQSITDPAALAWLASSCSHNNIENFCLAAGLDAAIVKHDSGNLLPRLPLLDETTIESALLQSTRVRSYYDEAGATWYPELYPELETLRDDEQFELEMSYPMFVMSAAIIQSSFAVPSFGPLAQFCELREDPEDDATAACARFGDEFVETGRTLFEHMVGMALRRQLAERAGNAEEDEILKGQSEDVYATHICNSEALRSTWETMTRDEVEAWIAEQLEYGELRAYARAAERAGVDCSNPTLLSENASH
ncbi:hypothetical protein [Halomonas denitrificans]|nr:hypothetical protein [Halomonas denitrificans]